MATSLETIQKKIKQIDGFELLQDTIQVEFIRQFLEIEEKIVEAQSRLSEGEQQLQSWSWEYAASWIPGSQTTVNSVAEELNELHATKQSILGELYLNIAQVKKVNTQLEKYQGDDARSRAALILSSIPGFYRLPEKSSDDHLSQENLINDYIEKEKQVAEQANNSEYELKKGIQRIYRNYVFLIKENTKESLNKFDTKSLRGRHFFTRKEIDEKIEVLKEQKL